MHDQSAPPDGAARHDKSAIITRGLRFGMADEEQRRNTFAAQHGQYAEHPGLAVVGQRGKHSAHGARRLDDAKIAGGFRDSRLSPRRRHLMPITGMGPKYDDNAMRRHQRHSVCGAPHGHSPALAKASRQPECCAKDAPEVRGPTVTAAALHDAAQNFGLAGRAHRAKPPVNHRKPCGPSLCAGRRRGA